MKAKPILLLVVALGCGLVAMLGVQQVMSEPTDKGEAPPVDDVQIMVATTEIKPFGVVDESNSKLVSVPRATIEAMEGVVMSYDEVVDMKLRTGAVKGEYILAGKLVDKNYKPSSQIPKGYRVVTVKVNQTKSHSGLMQPGDRVDVILTMKVTKAEDDVRSTGAKYLIRKQVQKAITVLQNVEVFATDNMTQGKRPGDETAELNVKNVSLLVTPKNANLLMLAETRGLLTLSLRGYDDGDKASTNPIDDENLAFLGRGNIQETLKKDKPGNDFQKFVQGQDGKTGGSNSSADQKSGDDEGGGPKWKLVIYEGKKPVEYVVEDPNAPKVPVNGAKSPTSPNLNTVPEQETEQPKKQRANPQPEKEQNTTPSKLD